MHHGELSHQLGFIIKGALRTLQSIRKEKISVPIAGGW